MDEKGFTLIELLAVIVILSIIALIATPMILGVIDSAKRGAAESSTYGYIDALEKSNLQDMIDNGNYQTRKDGIYDLNTIGTVNYKGKQPSKICITIKDGIVENGSFQFDKYIIDYQNRKAKVNSNKKEVVCGEGTSNKLLYAPFDEIGTVKSPPAPKLLIYSSFDEIGKINIPVGSDFLKDSVSGNLFSITNGNIIANTVNVKIGNQSAYFPGTSGQRINKNGLTDLNFGTKDFTIALWIYPETQTFLYPMLFSYETDNNNLRLALADNQSSGNIALIWDTTRIINTGKKYKPNTWTHYAVVRKDGIFTIYENGISIGSTSAYKTANVNLSNLSLGGNSAVSNCPYKGYMDDFAIYNYAKYTENFTPTTNSQEDANLIHLDFEPNSDYVVNNDIVKEEISNTNFSVLGGATLTGTSEQKKIGKASLYFPGTSGQRINKNGLTDLNFGTKDFTIALWVYPETQTFLYPMLFSYETDNNNLRLALADNQSSGNIALIWDTTRIINTGKKYKPNTWTHYAVVRKDGIFTIYENGISIGSTSAYKTANVNLSDLSLGGNSAVSNCPYKGYMDDFAIYNYAKYTENFTPATESQLHETVPLPPVGNEQLAKDIISNTYFTNLGNTEIIGTSEQKKFGKASLYFPGTSGQRINKNGLTDLNFGTKDFTIALWVYPETQTFLYPMLFSYETDNNNLRLALADNQSSGNIALIWDTTRIINTGKKYKPNTWAHYAVVRKDGIFTIYENGISIGSTSAYKTANVNLSNLSLGGNSSVSNCPYKGYMDDFVIYNKAIYDNNFNPPNSAVGN